MSDRRQVDIDSNGAGSRWRQVSMATMHQPQIAMTAPTPRRPPTNSTELARCRRSPPNNAGIIARAMGTRAASPAPTNALATKSSPNERESADKPSARHQTVSEATSTHRRSKRSANQAIG